MNIILSNSAKFNPYTFDEMLKPIAMAAEAYNKTQEGLAELEGQAGAIKQYIEEHPNSKYATKYTNYLKEIEKQADSLNAVGLTPDSRQALFKLRSRYIEDINPIQNAIKRRRELADEQRKAKLQNPTLMFERDFNSVSDESSLDRFLENPDYDYGASYSGNLITQQVSQMASHLSKELRNNSVGRLDNYTKTFLNKYGLSSDEVAYAINNPKDPKASKALRAIFDAAVGPVPQALQDKYMEDITNYATLGFWSAVGQDRISIFDDYGSRLAAQQRYANQGRGKGDGDGDDDSSKSKVQNPTPIISSREVAKTPEAISKYSQYFYTKNGKWRLNKKGIKAYFDEVSIPDTNPNPFGYRATPTTAHSSFRTFMDSLGASKYIYHEGTPRLKMDLGALGNLWGNYKNQHESSISSNGIRRMEYMEPIRNEDQQDFKNMILTAARDTGKLYSTDMDNESGQFVGTNEDLNLKDLNTDDYTVVARADSRFGEYGNSVFIKDPDGKVKRYAMPKGIHYTAEQEIQKILHNMGVIENGLMDKTLTDEERAVLLKDYQYYSDMYSKISGNIGTISPLAVQKNNPYSW